MVSIEDHQAKLQVLYDKAIENNDYPNAFEIAKEMYQSSVTERTTVKYVGKV